MKTKIILLLSLVILLILLAPLSALAAPQGKIAFIRNGDVWIMNADGGGQVNLTKSDSIESNLAWSNDGKQLAFSRMEDIGDLSRMEDIGDFYTDNLWIMNADGSKQVQLTFYKTKGIHATDNRRAYIQAYSPAWSPDGRTLAYIEYSNDPDLYAHRVVLFDLISKEKKILPKIIYTEGRVSVSWSPDSKKLTISEYGEGAGDIDIIELETFHKTHFEHNTNYEEAMASWAPNGKRIAYVEWNYEQNWGALTLSRPDGSGREIIFDKQLSGLNLIGNSPSWSPDSKSLVFSTTLIEGNGDTPIRHNQTYSVNVDGTNFHKIADNASEPAWQPVNLPAPIITSPANQLKTERSRITIRGRLGKDTDLSRSGYYVTLYRNGKLIKSRGKAVKVKPNKSGNFTKQIHLTYGENNLSAALNWGDISGPQSTGVKVIRPSRRTAGFGSDYSLYDKDNTVNTKAEIKRAKAILSSAGYNAWAYLNSNAVNAFNSLASNSIFHFSGHGNWDVISFVDNSGKESLLITDIDRNGSYAADSFKKINPGGGHNFSAVDLAVFNSCDAAKDINTNGNIMKAFIESGVKTAIGFKGSINSYRAMKWDKAFWDYAVQEKEEVGIAATKAAQDNRATDTFSFSGSSDGIAPRNLVVKLKNPSQRVYIYAPPPRIVD